MSILWAVVCIVSALVVGAIVGGMIVYFRIMQSISDGWWG